MTGRIVTICQANLSLNFILIKLVETEMPQPQRLVVLIEQLRIVEQLLISGSSVGVIADAIGVSDRQARRHINDLKSLGVQISSGYVPGDREPAIHRAKKSTRIFR